MRRPKPRALYAVVGLAAASIVVWFTYSVFAMPNVQPHVGDGRFANRSWRFPWKTIGLPIVGYSIEFERFELSEANNAAYGVAKLPVIGKEAGVYLCITDPNRKLRTDESRKQLRATIEIIVTDREGATVCHVKQPLSQMIWADPEGGRDTYGLYNLDQSVFQPDQNEEYRIQTRYVPDPALAGFEGFIYIRCGGSI